MKNIVFIILFCGYMFNPVSAQTKEEKKEEKAKQDVEDFEKMKALIDGKVYEFEASWMTSAEGVRINIMSGSNSLRIKNDSIDVNLAYFGVLQSGSAAINGGGGVEVKGLMQDYTTSVDEKKMKILIKYKTNKSPDQFQFIMTVHKNGNTSISVSSNVRSTAKYSGVIREIKE